MCVWATEKEGENRTLQHEMRQLSFFSNLVQEAHPHAKSCEKVGCRRAMVMNTAMNTAKERDTTP
eukprot:m.66419 g.66419  ORF g.66419 m.66419 type:complete len:65 (+) comp18079_c0_seq1:432-626(+)